MTPEGFKNRGRPRSSIPLEQRKRIYGARARAKRQAWLASHPAEAARVRKKSRESQREWRWKNIRRFRVNARRRYRLVCAQNPAHRTLAQWHEENRQAWLVRGKKWTSEAERCRVYRTENAAAIRARDKIRRAKGIKNLAPWYLAHLLAKSSGLKRRSLAPGLILAKRALLAKARAANEASETE